VNWIKIPRECPTARFGIKLCISRLPTGGAVGLLDGWFN